MKDKKHLSNLKKIEKHIATLSNDEIRAITKKDGIARNDDGVIIAFPLLYAQIKVAFLDKKTSVTKWCRENGIDPRVLREVYSGFRNMPKEPTSSSLFPGKSMGAAIYECGLLERPAPKSKPWFHRHLFGTPGFIKDFETYLYLEKKQAPPAFFMESITISPQNNGINTLKPEGL